MKISEEKHQYLLEKHCRRLSRHHPLWIDDDYAFVIVGHVLLPPGYNLERTNLLIELPDDYPVSPPGIGDFRVYVSPHLRFQGRELKDLHLYITPSYTTLGFGPWAWWCYQSVRWYPKRDNLIRFVEMIRADLTDPPTK
jgi:hypothetical protein